MTLRRNGDSEELIASDTDALIAKLTPTSTTNDRLTALIEAGLPSQVLADSIGVTPNSIRNWTSGSAEPRRKHSRRIDDIRFVAFALLTQTELNADETMQWLTSRSPVPPHNSPLEEIRENPGHVIEIMHSAIQEHQI